MFDTSNAFAVRGNTIPPLLWDTFQEAVAQDMQARARKEGHIARMPSINPDKPPPIPYAAWKDRYRDGRLKVKTAIERQKTVLRYMPEGIEITAVEIADRMKNTSATSVARCLEVLRREGKVTCRKVRRDKPFYYRKVTQ